MAARFLLVRLGLARLAAAALRSGLGAARSAEGLRRAALELAASSKRAGRLLLRLLILRLDFYEEPLRTVAYTCAETTGCARKTWGIRRPKQNAAPKAWPHRRLP